MIKKLKISNITILSSITMLIVTINTIFVCSFDHYDFGWLFIVINYLLALLPYIFANLTKFFYDKNKKIFSIISCILWLLFFPNAPYMITDLKYISTVPFEQWNKITAGSNIFNWLFLTNVALCVFMGVLIGMYSLKIMHELILFKSNKIIGWLCITLISIISAFGIYIGRFARVNSWDILRPKFLIENILNYLNEFSFYFIAIFSVQILLIYVAFYVINVFNTKNFSD